MLRHRTLSRSPGALPGIKSPAMEQTIIANENRQKRKYSFGWGLFNIIVALFFIYDLSYKCPLYTTIFNYFEYVAVAVFSFSSLWHFCRYFYYTLKTETVTVTPDQKRLLGIKDTDKYFKIYDNDKETSTPIVSPDLKAKDDFSFNATPMNLSAASWLSGSPQNDSLNYSMPSPSWVYHRGSPEQQIRQLQQQQHHHWSNTVAPQKQEFYNTSGVEFINDERTLKKYLNDFGQYEKSVNVSSQADQSSNLLSSFWSHPVTQSPNEVSPYFRKTQYQLSPQDTSATSSSNGTSDENRASLNTSATGSEIWKRLQIEPEVLIQWNANLRMWISQTILERLVHEINNINDEFAKLHLNDVRIGSVGLERLRKTAQTMPVVQYVPTLKAMLPFLEATPNQEYLVKRIKELAKGGCMGDFKWNSGGSCMGKEWDDSLITDSELIMYLLATYLDSQLVPFPNQPDTKPFSKEHLIRIYEKVPQMSQMIAIHQITEKPPHFRLIVDDEVFEIAKGHNNLFYTVLLFLYFVNKKEHGMLGKVNMGRSGVNMLWIIGEN